MAEMAGDEWNVWLSRDETPEQIAERELEDLLQYDGRWGNKSYNLIRAVLSGDIIEAYSIIELPYTLLEPAHSLSLFRYDTPAPRMYTGQCVQIDEVWELLTNDRYFDKWLSHDYDTVLELFRLLVVNSYAEKPPFMDMLLDWSPFLNSVVEKGFVEIVDEVIQELVRYCRNVSAICSTALRSLNPTRATTLAIAEILLRYCALCPELNAEGFKVQLLSECAARGITNLCTWILDSSIVM